MDEVQNSLICTSTGGRPHRVRKKHDMTLGKGNRIVELLITGKSQADVVRETGYSKSLVNYHFLKAYREQVLDKGVRSSFLPVIKGPCYGKDKYKIRKRRRSPCFVLPTARIHLGNGSGYRINVLKFGELHTLKIGEGKQDLFPRGDPKGRLGDKHHTGTFPLLASIAGYEGAAATVLFYVSSGPKAWGGRLEISLPELRLDLAALRQYDNLSPFLAACNYIKDHLSKNGWRFGEVIFQEKEVHYAFSSSFIQLYAPMLIWDKSIHHLHPGDKETDYPLFWDNSVPEGELETTGPHIALSLLATLTYQYEKATKKPVGKSKAKGANL